ncbi:MAG: mechanosensitive ion channel family protein [Candidatus Marinimicrobia bacterium]|jgi:small-conductance mechanosensitive channel|nr:mechanosensitive ion channel family protein [Candidatus Neomarinimicrobiota bacterium]|tara:strand:+ start:84 stop:1148 length:1065 start_codon:yes stop_codon:yes gene_type:complete
MDWYYNNIEILGPPALTIVCGILLGFIFKRFVHSRLKKAAERSNWAGDDAVLEAIEPHIVVWFFLGALSISVSKIEAVQPQNTYLISILNDYAPKFLIIVLIGSITLAIGNLAVSIFDLWARDQEKGFPSTTMFTNFVRIAIYVIGILIILDALSISITPMITALGVGGIAVSLALKDTLTDVFAGLHILLSKKVQVGDFIQLDSGEMGYIQNISWRNTIMMERTNNIIHIPNTRLSSAIIKNFDSGDPSFSVKIPVGVGYSSDLDEVEKVTKKVINEIQSSMEETNNNYEPTMRFQNFGESSINLMVYFRGNRYGDQNPIIHQFIKTLHKRYSEAGIEIPFPMRTVIHKNEQK